MNTQPPRLLSIPGNQTIYIGEGTLSGSTRVDNLVVRADVGAGESLSAQTLSLNCNSSNGTLTLDCSGTFDSSGQTMISIRHGNNSCVSGTATITVEAQDEVPNNPDSPILRSAPMTFSVQMINACLNFEKKIPGAGDRYAQGNFGTKLSSDGVYMAVAAPGDDLLAQDAGAIHIYKKESGVWNFKQKINPNFAKALDKIDAVSISNDRLIIGVPYYDNDPMDPANTSHDMGSAHIYERSGETWNLVANLVPSGGNSFGQDKFGKAVAISGNIALVGAPHDSTGNIWARGAVYVYVKSGISWVLQTKIIDPGTGMYDEFGKSLAMTSTAFIVGAPANYPNFVGAGTAFMYRLVGASWVADGELPEVNGKVGSLYGDAVATDGTVAVVGAMIGNGRQANSGSAYVYRRVSGVWTFQTELNHSDGAAGDEFGISVSVSGNDIVVGARKESSQLFRKGAAYHYKWNGSAWTQFYKILARDRVERDFFGASVSVNSGFAIVGSPLDDGDATYVDGLGAFYSFQLK